MVKKSKLYTDSWKVAFRKNAKGNILTDKATPFQIIKNSWRYWAADPFLFTYNNTTYIFAELYDYLTRKGTLGYCKLDNSKKLKWKKVISESYHLSYPYIFNIEDDIYIIPESNESHSVYMYKSTSFPNKWEKKKVLRTDVIYVDTTPCTYVNHNIAITYDISNNEQYKLHLLNLVDESKDIQIDGIPFLQRPAGNFFKHKNNIVRPAQICKNEYGEGLIFYEISFDSFDNYKEDEITRIYPEELTYSKRIPLNGMHTYNILGEYEVIDIKTQEFNVIDLLMRIFNKLKCVWRMP